MNSEAEAEQSTIPMLPLFSLPPMQSPEHPGTLTPPLHTSVSVPFRWEDEPGKPRPCTALVPFSNPTKCLQLPPRLLIEPKILSPLEGNFLSSSNRFQSPPSFRISKDPYGSFGDERGQLGALVLNNGGIREKGWFGSWWQKGFKVKREVSWGSHVFPSFADKESDVGTIGGSHNKRVEMRKMKRSGSFSSLTQAKSRVWTTIAEGLKHMVPWRSKKLKKGGYGNRL